MKFFTQKMALLVLASGLLTTTAKPEINWTKIGLITVELLQQQDLSTA